MEFLAGKRINGTKSELEASTTNIQDGSIFETSDENLPYVFNSSDSRWYGVGHDGFYPPIPIFGIFAGGFSPNQTTMDYIDIATTGNATDFGDLTSARRYLAGLGNETRGVFASGWTGSVELNVMDYVEFDTTGNATDFGDLTTLAYGVAGVANTTRGCFGGGQRAGSNSNIIDYITIASTGNATDFGDLTRSKVWMAGVDNESRGVFAGGYTATNIIDYITIDTTGNATDFGDLTATRSRSGGVSNATRGVFAGGYEGNPGSGSTVNTMEYITIASTGNSTDFGDLTQSRQFTAGVSNTTRGCFGGGAGGGYWNTIDYITVDTTGNAADFGDLTVGRGMLGSASP